MKTTSKLLVVTTVCILGPACVETALESETAKISPDVTVLEREPGRDVTVLDDRLIFPYGDDLSDVSPGRVLVSGLGSGFLRRAVSVGREGEDVVVQTEPASLTDVIIDGEIEESADPSPASVGSWAGGWGGDDREGHDDMRMGGFAVGLGGTTIVASGDLSVTIPEGHFDFDPDIDFGLDIQNRQIEHFRLIASGEIDAALAMDLQIHNAYASGRYQVPVWKKHKMFMQMVGIVPVVEMVELTLGVGVMVDAMGEAHASWGGRIDARVAAGARFDDGEWHAVGDRMVSFQILPLVVESDGMIGIRGYVYAEVAVMFYDAVGPALMIMPYIGAAHHEEITQQGGHAPHSLTPRVGVMGMFEAMVSIPIVDKAWVGYQVMLFDVYQDLGGRQHEGSGDSPGPVPGEGHQEQHTEHGGHQQ